MSIDSPGQLALPAESAQKQSPDFADVRNFLNHTSIGGGLSEGELDDIINNPAKAADEAVACCRRSIRPTKPEFPEYFSLLNNLNFVKPMSHAGSNIGKLGEEEHEF